MCRRWKRPASRFPSVGEDDKPNASLHCISAGPREWLGSISIITPKKLGRSMMKLDPPDAVIIAGKVEHHRKNIRFVFPWKVERDVKLKDVAIHGHARALSGSQTCAPCYRRTRHPV